MRHISTRCRCSAGSSGDPLVLPGCFSPAGRSHHSNIYQQALRGLLHPPCQRVRCARLRYQPGIVHVHSKILVLTLNLHHTTPEGCIWHSA